MLKPKGASVGKLERAVAKYEAKLARASNPTQRQYASSMLRMAAQALAESRAGEPDVEPADPDVVTLHPGEYSINKS